MWWLRLLFLSLCTAVAACIYMTAPANAAVPGVEIQGAVTVGPSSYTAPAYIMADRDIDQPEWYIPHIPPDSLEPEAPEDDQAGEEEDPLELEPRQRDPEDEGFWIEDGGNSWWIPPEAYNSYPAEDDSQVLVADIPLGYSGDLDELQLLTEIRETQERQLFFLTFCGAGVIVFIICRAVWPLFRGW